MNEVGTVSNVGCPHNQPNDKDLQRLSRYALPSPLEVFLKDVLDGPKILDGSDLNQKQMSKLLNKIFGSMLPIRIPKADLCTNGQFDDETSELLKKGYMVRDGDDVVIPREVEVQAIITRYAKQVIT